MTAFGQTAFGQNPFWPKKLRNWPTVFGVRIWPERIVQHFWACSTFFGRVQHFWACSTFLGRVQHFLGVFNMCWACSTFLLHGPSSAGTPPDPAPHGPPSPRTAQNFALFSLSRHIFLSFFPLLGVFSWNFGGVFEGRDPQMCTFGLSGCRVEPRRLWAPTLRGPTLRGPTHSPPTPTHNLAKGGLAKFGSKNLA